MKNCFDIDPEEVPKVDDVTYMLEPALSTTASGAFGMDESLVIFCIDISGSMCVTTAVSQFQIFHLSGLKIQYWNKQFIPVKMALGL